METKFNAIFHSLQHLVSLTKVFLSDILRDFSWNEFFFFLFFPAESAACTSAVLFSYQRTISLFSWCCHGFALYQNTFERQYLSWKQSLPYLKTSNILLEMAFSTEDRNLQILTGVFANIHVDIPESCARFLCVLLLKHVNVIQVNSITYPVKSVPWKMRLYQRPQCWLFISSISMTKDVRSFFDCSWWAFWDRFSHCI